MKNSLIVIISLLLFSCSESDRLKSALEFAGKNRSELEKVLKHYSTDSESGLKYRAACFLIENMPRYFSYTCEEFEKIKKEIYPLSLQEDCSPSQALRLLEEKYGTLNEDKFKKVYDTHIITSEYLIDNIELSFKVWQESPWGKNISFEHFCEEILPYRVGNEPIEYWKKTYYDKFQAVLNQYPDAVNSVRACQYIYAELSKINWLFDPEIQMFNLGALTLLEHRFGDCHDRCDLAVYAMRSVGIPCGIDFIIQAPEKRNPHHYWNYMRDEKNRCVDFALVDMVPDTIRQQPHYKRGKVYRKCFGAQSGSSLRLLKQEKLFSELEIDYILDVSSDYFPQDIIEIPMNNTGKVIYINVFNNINWIPVGYTTVENRKVTFKHLEPNIVYHLTYYIDNDPHPVDVPFIYEGKGVMNYLWPNTSRLQTIRIDRKYPLSERMELFARRLLNGKFQCAKKPDFSDSITLHVIKDIPELKYQNIVIEPTKAFKYYRYLSGENGHCDMAEISFFSQEDNLPVKGKVIGTEMSFWNDPKIKKESVFDGDPLTYFSANDPDNAWVGLELQQPVSINKIRYIGRNDDNGIRIGDKYELFYFSKNGNWISLGERTGTEESLVYDNVPEGALLWLRNLTRGREERIFTYENDKQIWW